MTRLVITAAASKYSGGMACAPAKAAGNAAGKTRASALYDQAAPVPSAIRVHMFGLRLRRDCQPRAKMNPPIHHTTGVLNRACPQATGIMPSHAARPPPGSISLIAARNTGTVRASDR